MTRPTAAQVWRRLVEEAGEDQIAAVLSMSQEQVDAELAGAGLDLQTERQKADRFLEDLLSGALDESPSSVPTSAVVAIAQPQHRPEPWHRRRPRTALVLLVAATAGIAAGATYVAMHQEPAPAPSSPPPPEPAPAPSPTASVIPDLVAAADWRSKAVAACDAKDFETCLADLDIARALDPDGDDTPLVARTRDRAIKGVLEKRPPKPPKPY
ncbi:MAG TPA: hypothetical protein VF765_21240 [Polyangiaceae bacterium]